ncbi:MAG: ferredoxin [Planctomycetota bacterium]|nr:MAG: ferredoxin [Planctomycetota bacterium]
MPNKKIIHFRNDCIGCGNCVEYSSEYWELDDHDGKANLIGAQEKRGIFSKSIEPFDEEINQQAADSCPVNIIQVR